MLNEIADIKAFEHFDGQASEIIEALSSDDRTKASGLLRWYHAHKPIIRAMATVEGVGDKDRDVIRLERVSRQLGIPNDLMMAPDNDEDTYSATLYVTDHRHVAFFGTTAQEAAAQAVNYCVVNGLFEPRR